LLHLAAVFGCHSSTPQVVSADITPSRFSRRNFRQRCSTLAKSGLKLCVRAPCVTEAPGEVGTVVDLLDWMLMRFTIRKATKGWMVWDTAKKRVAEVDDRPAIGISEESAKRIADMLNSQDQLSAGRKDDCR